MCNSKAKGFLKKTPLSLNPVKALTKPITHPIELTKDLGDSLKGPKPPEPPAPPPESPNYVNRDTMSAYAREKRRQRRSGASSTIMTGNGALASTSGSTILGG